MYLQSKYVDKIIAKMLEKGKKDHARSDGKADVK